MAVPASGANYQVRIPATSHPHQAASNPDNQTVGEGVGAACSYRTPPLHLRAARAAASPRGVRRRAGGRRYTCYRRGGVMCRHVIMTTRRVVPGVFRHVSTFAERARLARHSGALGGDFFVFDRKERRRDYCARLPSCGPSRRPLLRPRQTDHAHALAG